VNIDLDLCAIGKGKWLVQLQYLIPVPTLRSNHDLSLLVPVLSIAL
jgi:hypothetical protein